MDKNDTIETIESFLERYVLPEGRDAARKVLDEMLTDAHNEGYNEGYDEAADDSLTTYEGPWSIGL
jgi:hypothetical protein